MKVFKRAAGILLALILVFSLSATAFAAETSTPVATEQEVTQKIGVNNDDKNTYQIYQIFAGDFSEQLMVDVLWGANGTGTRGERVSEEILKEIGAFLNESSERKKLDVIEKYVDLSKDPVAVLSSDGTDSAELPTGYYLIRQSNAPGQGDLYSLYVVNELHVQDGINIIAPKEGTVESKKKVKDANDSTGTASGWIDSADYDVEDSVPFQLSTTLPSIQNFKGAYELTFHDKMDVGLSAPATDEGFQVRIKDTLIEMTKTYETTGENGDLKEVTVKNYEIVRSPDTGDECAFHIHFFDIKATAAAYGVEAYEWGGEEVTVEFNATLNDKALMGTKGNSNSFYTVYSSDPNDEEKTNSTPVDITTVFTYQLKVDKVELNPKYDEEKDPDKDGTDSDGDEKYLALEGAGFTLYKKNKDGEYEAVGEEVKGDGMTKFCWERIDDGDYKLVESTRPAGYNKLDDIYFTVEATHTEDCEDEEESAPVLTALAAYLTDESGNKIQEENENGQKLVDEKGNPVYSPFGTVTLENGLIESRIENKAGTNLPNTGGIGTTVFYAVGTVLLVGSAVLLVAKKRAGEEK